MSEVKQFRLPDVGEGLTEADIVAWQCLSVVGGVRAVGDRAVGGERAGGSAAGR